MAVFDGGVFDSGIFDAGGTPVIKSSFSADAYIAHRFTVNAAITNASAFQNTAFQHDAFQVGPPPGTGEIPVRALLLKTSSSSFSVAAWFPWRIYASTTLDARIMPRFFVNAVLLKTQEFTSVSTPPSNLKLDYRWGPGGSIAIDAIRKSPMSSGDALHEVSRGKSGWMSTSYYGGFADVVDGNDATSASTNNGLNNWYAIDLLVPTRIVQFRLRQYGGSGGGYNWSRTALDLQYGPDGSTWTTLVSFTGLVTDQTLVLPVNPLLSARYWRMYATAGGTNGWEVATFALWSANLNPFTADAMFSSGHFTLEAWVWTGDANLQLSQAGFEAARTGTPNTWLSQSGLEVAYVNPIHGFWADAVIATITTPTGSFTVDARIHWQFTADAWLWIGDATLEISHAGFEAARTGFPNTIPSQSGVEVAYEKPKGTFGVDARLAIITHPTGSFTVDARIHWQFTVDAWLWTGDAGVRVTQFGFERARTALIINTLVAQAGIEVARGGFPGAVASQVGIEVAVERPKGTIALNATIYRPGDSMTPATFTVDAFKVFIIHLDATFIRLTTGSFTVAAAIARRITGILTLDANVQLGFLLDAVFILPQPAVFTLFAYKVVKTTGAGSFTLDAFKSRAFTVGAWITKPRPFTVNAAIIEAGKYLKSFPSDAVVTSLAGAGEFLLEAEIWNQRTVVYEGEGANHVDRNLITDRLSIPGFRSPVADVNAIYGPFYPIDTYPVTLTIYNLQPAGDLIDDRSVGVHAANETNLWSWYTGPGTYTFWPADYFIEHYVYTWPGPFNPVVTGSGMISFYRDDTVIDALPAPTLDAWIVGTPGEPFTLDAEIVELEKRWSFLLDAELSRVGEKRGQVTLDAFIVGRVEGIFHAFAEIAALHFMVEAIIWVPSFTLDAHIHLVGGADATFVADAVIKATMSWYPRAPAIDAVIVRHTHYAAYALNAELVAVNDRRSLMRLDAIIVATRPAKRFYLAALIIPDVSFSVGAYIGHYLTVDAWVGSANGGMGSFFVGAYIRGSSIIIFPEDGGPPTDLYGGPPAIARKFSVKIEAFIPDPIPVGNDQEIENLIMKILEAEAELEALYCAVEHYSSQGYPIAGGRNSYGGGYTGSLPNAISQIGYPGAGDIDDCWVVATVWAAIASGQTFQPTVPQFRAWAQNPDRPGATGGTLDHIMRGARGAWPGASIRRFASSDWNGFISLLKAGWTASLAVRSSGLPSNLRYGFNGLHQVGVAYQNGSYVIMNPLQSTGSSLHTIDGYDLRTAARGFTGGTICACMFR